MDSLKDVSEVVTRRLREDLVNIVFDGQDMPLTKWDLTSSRISGAASLTRRDFVHTTSLAADVAVCTDNVVCMWNHAEYGLTFVGEWDGNAWKYTIVRGERAFTHAARLMYEAGYREAYEAEELIRDAKRAKHQARKELSSVYVTASGAFDPFLVGDDDTYMGQDFDISDSHVVTRI